MKTRKVVVSERIRTYSSGSWKYDYDFVEDLRVSRMIRVNS